MDGQIEGIVLSKLEYGDNTLIIDFYSAELGKITFSATNSKKKNSRFYFSPLNLLQLNLYTSKKSKYFRLKELQSINPDQLINRDNEVHAIRFFLAELLKKILTTEEADPRLYLFLKSRITDLYSSSSKSHYILDFLIDLSPFLGIDFDQITKEDQLLDEFSFDLSKEDRKTLIEGRKNRKAYLNALLRFYSHQYEGLDQLKSKAVLAEVFSD